VSRIRLSYTIHDGGVGFKYLKKGLFSQVN